MSENPTDIDSLVSRVKGMLYLDGNEDDQLIATYVKAAHAFIRNAIGEVNPAFYTDQRVSSLVEVAEISLAGTYYQNRLALSDTQTYPIDLTVNSIIGQLRGLRNSYDEENDKNETSDQPAES
ncbi:head-tail connector protein [Limosilactobacillus balticus]|uniref:head-tail connector protein n=1 Tax=Limosilactobacillus balticus TaxID=2759747 RepID=UPI001E2A142E|nr:head-tail connector protein [Limosilactobacillus balticus]MCD7135986.1 head-tail connector protein [Limosilactobacillus balticus]